MKANNAAPKAGVMLAGPHPIPLSACGWRSDVGFPQALFPGVASHGDERREARERNKDVSCARSLLGTGPAEHPVRGKGIMQGNAKPHS